VLQPPAVLELVSCELGEQYNALTGARDLITLQANNRYRGARGQAAAELLCTSGGKLLWRDIVPGQVLHLLGTSSFSVVATAAGELLVYSPAGRRLMPSIFRGHAACFARVHGASGVLLLTADGTLKLLDLLGHKCELKLDIRGLLGQGVSVLDVRMAPGGAAPLLALSSGQTLLYHPGLDEWLVAEDSSSALSSFHSLLPLPGRLGLAPGRLLPSENIAAATGQTAAWQVGRCSCWLFPSSMHMDDTAACLPAPHCCCCLHQHHATTSFTMQAACLPPALWITTHCAAC
jgi:hypothetical protein